MSATHKLRNIIQPTYSLVDIINQIDFNNHEHLSLLKDTATIANSNQIEIHNQLDLIDKNQQESINLILEVNKLLKEIKPMAEDSYERSVKSNSVHQEFLSDDRKTLRDLNGTITKTEEFLKSNKL
jgi:hypothetical protein